MSSFAGRVAIVTGGASGIGQAVAGQLVAAGARVVLADVDREGAVVTATALGLDPARAVAEVDVRDAGQVRGLVECTVAEHGKLDVMFNNAGIALFGDAVRMTLDDWNRLVDVNIRGVVHGIAAAYPVMRRQGFGHIVNTASAAGLVPTPGATGYSMTKHAVVGLSGSLRAEAARYGVKVSVVCPGFIQTPIIERAAFLGLDRQEMLEQFPFKLHSPEALARAVVRGVERNRAIITFTALARTAWFLYRISPSLMLFLLGAGTRFSPLLATRDE
jgi:NAD(P)-dependent dehydrogenase (short-subunit alcohol dehydrogenase family)